jgi:hypothetical protein
VPQRFVGRSGFTLYVVLIVVVIGALMAGSVVYSAQAQRSSADAAARRVESRAIAWSGVQAAMEELRSQRDEMIRGGEPRMPTAWTLFTDGQGRRAVARVVPAGGGELIVSEAGKLDVNTATPAMLAMVPGLDDEVAKRIVAARGGRKFLSVYELAGIEGLAAAFAVGSAAEPEVQDAFVPPEEITPSRPLSDVLTVFAFDPNVQAGMGRNAESHTGVRRISLSGTWSERLGRAITERFDEGAANVVKSLMEQGTKFEKESDIVKVLRRFNVPPTDWSEVLDAFCSDPGPYRLGRVDVLTAPQEVLECIPGFDAAAAEQVVLRRGKLAPEQRMSLVWLVGETILSPDQFERAVDHLAARSMQWRVVIEAGFVEEDSEDTEEEPELTGRVVVEAVLDVSSERARVAYLREVTMADAARSLGPLRAPRREAKQEEPPPAVAEPSAPSAVPAVSSGSGRAGRSPRPPSRPQGNASGEAGGSGAPADGSAGSDSEKDPRLGRWTPGQK